MPVPAERRPGSVWVEPPRPVAAGAAPSGKARVGYARASTARQSYDAQLDSLAMAGVTKVFAEKVSTRQADRPELDKAIEFAVDMRKAGLEVTLVAHEHKRLGRGIELAALAERLRALGISLEFRTGELQGGHDPSGIVFTVLAAMALLHRRQGLSLRESAAKLVITTGAKKGKHPSPPTVIRMLRDHDDAQALQAAGTDTAQESP